MNADAENFEACEKTRSSALTADQARLLELEASTLASAGAGTGKTRALTDLYLALLLGEAPQARRAANRPLRPAQIAAVTFTRKAAGELRRRVREALEERARRRDADATLRTHLRLCVEELPGAPIATIDSFCAGQLREAGIRAGVSPGFDVLRPENVADVYRRAFLAVAAELSAQPTHPHHAAFFEAAEEFGLDLNRHGSLPAELRKLRSALTARGLNPAEFDPPTSGALTREEFREFCRAMLSALPIAVKDSSQKALAQTREALEWEVSSSLPSSNEPFNARIKLLSVAPKGNAKWVKIVLRPALHAALGRAHGPLKAALAFLLRETEKRYAAEKRERGVLDFDDLLFGTRALLRRDEEFLKRQQQNFAFILIDEFQDTNALQAEIFCRLAFGTNQPQSQPAKLIVVGDEKQSIYRFRGADVGVFHATAEILGRKPLRDNFRSRAPLVTWFNDFFAYVASPPEFAAEDARKTKAPPASADDEAEAPGVVRFQYADHDRLHAAAAGPAWDGPSAELLASPVGRKEGGYSAARLRFLEAQAIARRIRAMVYPSAPVASTGETQPLSAPQIREQGALRQRIKYADIAVLARSLKSLRAPLETAFTELGVPFRLLGGAGFFTRREALDAQNLLTAVADPTADAAFLGFLRSPFAGLSDAALYYLRRDTETSAGTWAERLAAAAVRADDWAAAFAATSELAAAEAARIRRADRLYRRLCDAADRLSAAELLDQACVESGYLAVMALLPRGEIAAATVRRIIEAARRFERSGAVTLLDFTAWLRKRAEAEWADERLDDDAATAELAAELPENEDAVGIGTIHSAKGLEFNIVILADVGAASSRVSPALTFVPDLGFGLRMGCRCDDLQSFADRAHELCAARESVADKEELKRLLYVACTRAREYLIFSGENIRGKSWRTMLDDWCASGRALPTVLYDHPQLSAAGAEIAQAPLKFQNNVVTGPGGWILDPAAETFLPAARPERQPPAGMPEEVRRRESEVFAATVSRRLKASVSRLSRFIADPEQWEREERCGFFGISPETFSLEADKDESLKFEPTEIVEASESFAAEFDEGMLANTSGTTVREEAQRRGSAVHRYLEMFFQAGDAGVEVESLWRLAATTWGLDPNAPQQRSVFARLKRMSEDEYFRCIFRLAPEKRFVERPFARKTVLACKTIVVLTGTLDLLYVVEGELKIRWRVSDYKLTGFRQACENGTVKHCLVQAEIYALCAAEALSLPPGVIEPALLFLFDAVPRFRPTAELWAKAGFNRAEEFPPCLETTAEKAAAALDRLLAKYAVAVRRSKWRFGGPKDLTGRAVMDE